MPISFHTESGIPYHSSYADLATSTHLLVAGRTGCGKSVVLNGILGTEVLLNGPCTKLALLDPKGYDLKKYRDTPMCWGYAQSSEEIINLLRRCKAEVDRRNRIVDERGLAQYPGDRLIIVAEELLFLMTGDNVKEAKNIVTSIMAIGRTARVSFFGVTQCLRAVVLPTVLTANFTHKLCLQTSTKADSRMVVGEAGAESLPDHGKGLFCSPSYQHPIEIPLPMVTEEWTKARIAHYTAQVPQLQEQKKADLPRRAGFLRRVLCLT